MIGKTPNNSGKNALLVAWISRLVCIVFTLLPLLVGYGLVPPNPIELTGTWRANDQAYYYLRQIGDTVWWAGLGGDHGLSYTNVFRGRIHHDTNTLLGEWADVPRGANPLMSGMLTLNILPTSNGFELRKQPGTGGFSASVWTKVSIAQPECGTNIYCRFDKVLRRNLDSTMHGHLKMYKDNVSIYGTILNPPGGNWDPSLEPTYQNFECGPDVGEDGDISFDVAYQYNQPTPPDFWDAGKWLNNAYDLRNKLRFEYQHNVIPHVHAELIMYGKRYYTTIPTANNNGVYYIPDCSGHTPTLLPGWMETGSQSVLLNGRPVNTGRSSVTDVTSLLEQKLKPGALVRLRGFLAADCHDLGIVCEGNVDEPNVEIHPVYAIDVIQDFGRPRSPYTTLTGVWGGTNDGGTYYVHQLGTKVWWLGLSSDDGLNDGATFANVFEGTIQGNRLVGEWADIPLGMTQNGGNWTGFGDLCTMGSCQGINAPVRQWNKINIQGGPMLRKLYDVIVPCDVLVCDSINPNP